MDPLAGKKANGGLPPPVDHPASDLSKPNLYEDGIDGGGGGGGGAGSEDAATRQRQEANGEQTPVLRLVLK